MLTVLEELPDGLLSLTASELHTRLDGPTLIHLAGRREPPVFFAVLQHGNEHTGWEAVRQLLRDYHQRSLPRSLSLFIGNVAAARENLRFLDGQMDFNRSWGTSQAAAHPLMQQVIDSLLERDVFLSVDVHNNTGKNPHYACVNRINWPCLHLARLFSRTVIYFIRPEGVQSMAFAQFCPSVTVECGLSGEHSGVERVREFLDACLHLDHLPERPIPRSDLDLYHTTAIVKVPPELSIGFGDCGKDICLDENIEYYNFRDLTPGTALGWVGPDIEAPLIITDEVGQRIDTDYIALEHQKIITRRPCIPAMITRDMNAIRKDCLCYFMEHYPLPHD